VHADLPLIWRVDYGNLGVRVFFIISGFLITSLLLAERARTGTVNLTDFYVRRVFRIFPAYYVFLLVMAVVVVRNRILYHTVGMALLNVGLVLMLDRYMRFPATLTGRWLNWAPIAWIGTISYSLYLWQEPMTSLTRHLPVIVTIAAVLALATASRYFVEFPFLALRRKLPFRGPTLATNSPSA
jgi:peptidoglycan/LPS O-acetylase OafA/YrhL